MTDPGAPRSPDEWARAAPRTQIAVCFGLYSSGSTWVFNVLREIWRAEPDVMADENAFKSLYADREADLPLDIFDARRVVMKTHLASNTPADALLLSIAGCPGPVIVTARDPRDAVVSLMQRFRSTFPNALHSVVRSAQAIVQLAELREVFILRYEDGLIGSARAFDLIASWLGSAPSEELRARILASLAPEAVRSLVERLSVSGVISATQRWDPETHWHPDHIGDGRIGKYRDVLSETRQDLIAWRTAEFCSRFGYPLPVRRPLRLAVLTDIAFWNAQSLFAEWVRQWIEGIAQVAPVVVLCVGSGGFPDRHGAGALEVRPAPDASDIARILGEFTLLGTMFACADASVGRNCERACREALGAAVPMLDFVAPSLLVERDAVPIREFAVSPMRYLPGRPSRGDAILDRSQLLLIIEDSTEQWNTIALGYVHHLAAARGIAVATTICGPRAEHSPEFFRQIIERTVHPTIFIGQPCAAWAFTRQLLDLGGTPHLQLAANCIAPMVRSETGMPSLLDSIGRFLDDPARAASPPLDAGADQVLAALELA